MEVVAHYLQVTALAKHDATERDLFGRSSYNRYYYSAFLSVRQMLARLDPSWGRLPHADYPGLLRGQISTVLSKGRKKAMKLQDQGLISQCSRASEAARNLANLMASGNATRVVADYQPEIPVNFSFSGRFTLNSVDITEAHQWPERAKAWAKEVENAWRQLDV